MKTIELDLFERFNNNELNHDELIWFNNEINTNKEFASNYKAYLSINKILSEKKYRDLRLRFKALYKKESENKKVRKLFYSRSIAAAALLLLIISISFYYGHVNNLNEKNELFSTYYNDMFVKKGAISSDSLFSIATTEYISKNFEKSTFLFEQLCNIDSSNITYKFYLSMAYIGDSNYSKAEKILLFIMNDGNNLYIDNCQWYLAVLYYHNKDFSKSKQYFQEISTNKNHYKNSDAVKALEYFEN